MVLERTLEPEVMDSQQDAIEYDRMDHSAVNRQFNDEFLSFVEASGKRLRNEGDPPFDELDGEDSQSVLASFADVGTGTAQIPIDLCKRHSSIRVMAIEQSASMLDLAIRNIDVASLREQIQLAQCDARSTGFEDQMFDALISNSIIHHIADPESVVEEMVRITRDGGLIFVRDLCRPATANQVDELVQTYAGEESEYSRELFRNSLHAALTVDEMKAIVESFGFQTDCVKATSDRHWTWAVVS